MLDHLAVLKGFADRGERREMVEALLHQVNLWAHRNKALGGFSGGMRQRFGVAQALIGAPALIIVDEPTAGLDPEERNRFLDLLAEIGESVVVLLSTHIVADVADLCPAMAILCEGRIVRRGAPAELIARTRGRLWMREPGQGRTGRARASIYGHHLEPTARRAAPWSMCSPTSRRALGSSPTSGGLDDAYFSALSGRLAARPSVATA